MLSVCISPKSDILVTLIEPVHVRYCDPWIWDSLLSHARARPPQVSTQARTRMLSPFSICLLLDEFASSWISFESDLWLGFDQCLIIAFLFLCVDRTYVDTSRLPDGMPNTFGCGRGSKIREERGDGVEKRREGVEIIFWWLIMSNRLTGALL